MNGTPETVVANLPVWTFWVVALSQIVFALSMAAIAFAAISLLGQIKEILVDVKEMEREVKTRMPGMMTDVASTVGNVKGMSDDAKTTTGNVTSAVNRVAQVTHAVAVRLESPLVKSVGVMTGVVAGVRSLAGGKKREIVVERESKRRGILGRKK